ncbi:YceI family protein [Longitalea luteola]|uniref:YceI family protein n=1 Tax=Longitalea luteola TaxID=2812563 RepID=UPI001A9689C4|nr:YceI family protein [Longitalea luteola]
MKYFAGCLVVLFGHLNLYSQHYIPVDSSSEISFKIKNLGFNTTGSFSGLAGTITFLPDSLAGCSFDVTIDASTVNTGVDKRDDHLRWADFFDVKNYPQIRFVSEKINTSKKNGTLFVSGKLTIKGITKDLAFPFTAQPIENGFLFAGEFRMKRRDFNVGAGNTISDRLTVQLKVVARKAALTTDIQ